jgi:hypothetical protein
MLNVVNPQNQHKTALSAYFVKRFFRQGFRCTILRIGDFLKLSKTCKSLNAVKRHSNPLRCPPQKSVGYPTTPLEKLNDPESE